MDDFLFAIRLLKKEPGFLIELSRGNPQNRTARPGPDPPQGSVALYELYGPQCFLYGYEVIVIRFRKEREAIGKLFPEREGYPSNEEWGTYGFSFQARDLAGAQKRFAHLLPKWGANPNR